jgi:hypothetical protein
MITRRRPATIVRSLVSTVVALKGRASVPRGRMIAPALHPATLRHRCLVFEDVQPVHMGSAYRVIASEEASKLIGGMDQDNDPSSVRNI